MTLRRNDCFIMRNLECLEHKLVAVNGGVMKAHARNKQ